MAGTTLLGRVRPSGRVEMTMTIESRAGYYAVGAKVTSSVCSSANFSPARAEAFRYCPTIVMRVVLL
jgi:hypothetical protein